jgi:hypothetical protein
MWFRIRLCCAACVWFGLITALARLPLAAEEPGTEAPARQERQNSTEVLNAQDWKQLDRTVDRGLGFLSKRQQPDGSFEAPPTGQPGISSLCLLAFVSRGHLPGQGPYGKQINRGVDFLLSCQRGSGLFSQVEPRPTDISLHSAAHCGLYNHAVTGLTLCEIFGMADAGQQERMRTAIERAITLSQKWQPRYKLPGARDAGGWRYLSRSRYDNSDISATSWQLMFLRSAKNAGFDVPQQTVDDATAFVRRCFDPTRQTFSYRLGSQGTDGSIRRGIAGGGIMSLSMAGKHDTEIARRAGAWVLAHPFDKYNHVLHNKDRFHYGAFYCSVGMFQLGGEYWSKFYPTLMQTLVKHQRQDGSWDREPARDRYFGNTYTTALATLALTPPYHLLPIYQR